MGRHWPKKKLPQKYFLQSRQRDKHFNVATHGSMWVTKLILCQLSCSETKLRLSGLDGFSPVVVIYLVEMSLVASAFSHFWLCTACKTGSLSLMQNKSQRQELALMCVLQWRDHGTQQFVPLLSRLSVKQPYQTNLPMLFAIQVTGSAPSYIEKFATILSMLAPCNDEGLAPRCDAVPSNTIVSLSFAHSEHKSIKTSCRMTFRCLVRKSHCYQTLT